MLKPSGTKIHCVFAKEKMENYLALRLDEQDKALRDVVDELQRVQEKLGVRGFFSCLMGGMLTFFGLKTEGSVKDFQQLQSHGSMYGMFIPTFIIKCMPNVRKYSRHGSIWGMISKPVFSTLRHFLPTKFRKRSYNPSGYIKLVICSLFEPLHSKCL